MSPDEIIELRKSYNVTQEKFAHLVGTTHVSVNRWECGKAIPSRIFLKELKELKAKSGSYVCRCKKNEES